MTQEWQAGHVAVVAEEVRAARHRRRLSTQKLADACAQLGVPIDRSVLANLEHGRRSFVTVAELSVLALVLHVPPVALIFPLGRSETVEIVPGLTVPAVEALRWFVGDRPVDGIAWEDPAFVPRFLMHGNLVETVDHQDGMARAFREEAHDKRQAGREEAAAGLENDADAAHYRAERSWRNLVDLRTVMRERDLTPPALPAGLAEREAIDASADRPSHYRANVMRQL